MFDRCHFDILLHPFTKDFALLLIIFGCNSGGGGADKVKWEDRKPGQVKEFTTRDGKKTHFREGGISKNHGFGLAGNLRNELDQPVSEIYTGRSLLMDNKCVFGADSEGRHFYHLNDFLKQEYLLNSYAPGGRGRVWHQQALFSLEETDPNGLYRPKEAVVPNTSILLRSAFASPNMWVLNAVRFRPDNKPMQIKLNYELNRVAVKQDKAIASAHIIHSLAVPEEHEEKFVEVLKKIPQDPELSGCYIAGFLQSILPELSYFFWHVNMFDTRVDEWRFAEAKVVSKDFTEDYVIAEPYDIIQGAAASDDVLRIIPMQFDYMKVVSHDGKIEIDENKAPLQLWFSGTETDKDIDLLTGPQAPYFALHPARQHEEAFTCGQCHVRRSSARVNPSTGTLDQMPSMVARHIGFGDGGNCKRDPNFGYPRSYYRADLSDYLLDAANAWEFYGFTRIPHRDYITEEECLTPDVSITAHVVNECNWTPNSNWNKRIRFTIANKDFRDIALGSITQNTGVYLSPVSDTCSNTNLERTKTCELEYNADYIYGDTGTTDKISIATNSDSFIDIKFGEDLPDFVCQPPEEKAPVVEVSTVTNSCGVAQDGRYGQVLTATFRNTEMNSLWLQSINVNRAEVVSKTCENHGEIPADGSCDIQIFVPGSSDAQTARVVFGEQSPLYSDFTVDVPLADCADPDMEDLPAEVEFSNVYCSDGQVSSATVTVTMPEGDFDSLGLQLAPDGYINNYGNGDYYDGQVGIPPGRSAVGYINRYDMSGDSFATISDSFGFYRDRSFDLNDLCEGGSN